MVHCKSCGEPLADPEEDVYVPRDGEPDLNPGGHLKQVSGSKGTRLQCRETGQMTKVVDDSPDDGGGNEEPQTTGTGQRTASRKNDSSDPQPQSPSKEEKEKALQQRAQDSSPQQQEKVYDITEEKEAIDVLRETIQNPTYELNNSQINEIEDWAEIYDGHIPPNLLEDVCSNMSGVANQTAQLMRQKYEAKLNRWVRDNSERDQGPPIGAVPSPPSGGGITPERAKQLKRQKEMSSSGGSPSPNQGGGHPSSGGNPSQDGRPPQQENSSSSRPIAKRQDRAFNRRQRAMDKAIEEAAPKMAEEMTSRMGESYDLVMTIMKAKAEKDPDWFFEKMEGLGISLDDLAEPSDAKKREMAESGGGSDPDSKMDNILDEMEGNSEQPEPDPASPPPAPSTPQESQEPAPQPEHPPEPTEEVTNSGPHWNEEAEADGGGDDEIDPELDSLMNDINRGD